MIPRTLIPFRLPAAAPDMSWPPGRRHFTSLDSRTVVPSDLPVAPIDPKTSIPSHVPLSVLSARVLVPRDMPAKPLENLAPIPAHVPLAVLESRMVVPQDAKLDDQKLLASPARLSPQLFEDVLEPDLFTTGEVNLLAGPEDSKARDWQWLSRSFSLLVHVAVILLVLFAPGLFQPKESGQQINFARQQLARVFLPPSVERAPKNAPQPEPPSAHIRIDPRILRKLAPPNPEPTPLEGPQNPETTPQPEMARPGAATSPSSGQSAALNSPAFQPLSPPEPRETKPVPRLNLDLPHLSPGRELEQSAETALQHSSTSAGFAQPMPGGPPPSGTGGQGLLRGGVQILTPTQGVDFSNYLARLVARVKQNWISVMPISARMGDQGVVILQFRILHDGSMPGSDPFLVRTSTKEPLDRAAASAILLSHPFEPLPSAFTGPYIDLRFIFLYNLPLDYNYNQ